MKVTLNWLKEFVDISVTPEKLAELLTNSGNEVEEIIYQNKYLHDVVVGKILEIKQHPNAEKLVICQVDIGEKITQIITAAKNIKENDLVPVSLPGANLANGISITASKLRGEDSFGMFCSVEELGVTDYDGEINGIMILDNTAVPGTKIEDELLMNDVIFDVNVTANRPDCMSVMGLAREVSALLHTPFKEKQCSYNVDESDNVKNYIDVEVLDKQLCPRYMATAIKDINIKKSPKWLRARLVAVDIKPINNIVDITNYVLIECGQPMHGFDQKFINNKKIVVRRGISGEKIEVLNGNTYDVDESMLCICDDEKPVVIAGIIGGTNSCVTENTTTSVFEAACFERSNVRHTGRKIGVRTDSTARFEKGVDIGSPEIGMKRALALVSELKAGTIISGTVDVCEKLPTPKNLKFSMKRIEKLLGIKIDADKVLDILNNLGIKSTLEGDELSSVVPVYRTDIENDADIAEEIIRMYGYDVYNDIEVPLLSTSTVTIGEYDPLLKEARRLKLMLCDYGYNETVNFSICAGNVCDKLLLKNDNPRRNMIRISNPISEDIAYVRTSMANALFTCIAKNESKKNSGFRLFELGRVYLPKQLPLEELPVEENHISFASVNPKDDFFVLKGIVQKLLSDYELDYELKYSEKEFLHPGISADIINCANGEILGSFGKVHPKVCENFEMSSMVWYGELYLDKILLLNKKRHSVKMLSKYPVVERDLAIITDENVIVKDLETSIKKSCGALFYNVKLFDIYRSQAIGENKKSLAFNIKLLSYEKTLTDEEISSVMNKIMKDLSYKFGAQLR